MKQELGEYNTVRFSGQAPIDLAALVSRPVFVARQKKGHCLATGQLCKLHSLRIADAEHFVERRRRTKGKLGSLRQVQNTKGLVSRLGLTTKLRYTSNLPETEILGGL